MSLVRSKIKRTKKSINKNKLFVFCYLVISFCFQMEITGQTYFVFFADKKNNNYSISNPSDFLSERAISRREKQNISITEEDLPISQYYLDSIKNMGIEILWSSKWLNGAIISSSDDNLTDTIANISFIDSCKLIYPNSSEIETTTNKNKTLSKLSNTYSSGVYTSRQNKLVNGQYLHDEDYTGNGICIAVIDNGFSQVNSISYFDHLFDNNQIIATRDFVNPGGDVYNTESSHGTSVLSIMGGYENHFYCGSAPTASYLLLRTENDDSEYPIEEYNWVIAAEYADSIGADMIQSSLGYYTFDDSSMSYSYKDMDGKSTICVKGAETAFSKGMLVICSAGNEGNDDWHYIISPADGENVLAVGAVHSDSTVCSFSSYGPSYDQRIKPDVMAMGYSVAVSNSSGDITFGSGTSFAAPIISGFAACLWEEQPALTNSEMLQLIRGSANMYSTPDNQMGYGIANFKDVQNLIESHVEENNSPLIYPNPFENELHIKLIDSDDYKTTITLWNTNGNLVYSYYNSDDQKITLNDLNNLPGGLYILKIVTSSGSFTYKVVKKQS